MQLCIKTVIPSLFPFLVLSGYINSSLAGQRLKLLRPLGRICGIPSGCESSLVLGLFGGYPIGAQCIGAAYKSHTLSKQDAERMLGFCNNAGPAFIFGMLSGMFSNALMPWVLWAIHICSALVCGCLLPGKSKQEACGVQSSQITAAKAMEQGLKAIATICGWVIVFRVAIRILTIRVLWLAPLLQQIMFVGFMELTNGSLEAVYLPEELRFVLCSVFLGFGGVCIAMQTASVAKGLRIHVYLIGKILQASVSGIVSLLLLPVLFPSAKLNPSLIATLVAVFLAAVIFSRKNSSNFHKHGIQYRKQTS